MAAYLGYTLRMKTLFRVADQLWFTTRIWEKEDYDMAEYQVCLMFNKTGYTDL